MKKNIENFNPSGIGLANGHFIGLPFDENDAKVVIVSVPWDVSVSYSDGTSSAAANILEASSQLDLYDAYVKDAWKLGIYLRPTENFWMEKNNELRIKAKKYIQFLEEGGQIEADLTMKQLQTELNSACESMVAMVEKNCTTLFSEGKMVGVVGGDHSSPLGLMQALAKKHSSFGVLHIDAHMDLRNAYEGFNYSHASIFYNALKIPALTKLVQVGVRDYCEEEVDLIQNSNTRVVAYSDRTLKSNAYKGITWQKQCDEIISLLPNEVYISFDIDGLKPELCPNTGTPVPGGLEFDEAIYLLEKVVESDRKIIGFDLCEVAGLGNEWDGNVGARILYKLCNLVGKSNTLIG